MNITQTKSASASAETESGTRTASTIAVPFKQPASDPKQRSISPSALPQSVSTPTGADAASADFTSVSARAKSTGRFRFVLSASLVLSLMVSFSVRYLVYQRSWISTDNAYLAGHMHTISSRVAGNVKEVLVDEHQTVEAGTVLARLDPSDLDVRRLQAAAQVAQASAQVQNCQAGIDQAEAQTVHEQARATKALNDLARSQALFEGGAGAISKQELDLAKSEADAAEASLQGARSAVLSATASTAAARAQEKLARANLQEAQLQLSYTEIVAPAPGRIGKKNIEIGNRVSPGQALLALLQSDLWVIANFKETQLAHLKPGQLVRIKADAFPGHTFRGVVDSLSPASGAQFALLPPDNATGNFTKIVQRVPVKILIDKESLRGFGGHLVAGLSVIVEVQVRH
jgi:membrane fusion protein, multidrug efflux system